MVDQAIQMAILPSNLYSKTQKMFRMINMGKLKDQQLKKRKNPMTAKLMHFKIFQGLKANNESDDTIVLLMNEKLRNV